MKILKVVYKSKSVFFLLLFNWVLFSIIGFILFKGSKSNFDTFASSLESMFVLLSACDFPDIMINLFESRVYIKICAIIFFLLYFIISFFVIQGLLKALYYENYSEINLMLCKNYIKRVR